MPTINSAIFTKNYIDQSFLTTEMGLVFDAQDDALTYIPNAIYYASRRVNNITGNLIDKNAASGTNILANFTDYQQNCIKRATGEYTKWFLANGLTFLRGSTSGNLGSQINYSQSNPDQPDYIPQDVLTELQNAGLYQFMKTTNIDGSTGMNNCGTGTADMSGVPYGYTLISALDLNATYVRINDGITSSDDSIDINVVQGKVDLKAKNITPNTNLKITDTATGVALSSKGNTNNSGIDLDDNGKIIIASGNSSAIQMDNTGITLTTTDPTKTINFNGVVSAGGNQIKKLAQPTDDDDAATKIYVDKEIANIPSYIGKNGVEVNSKTKEIRLDQNTTDTLDQVSINKRVVDDLRIHVGDVSALNTPSKEVVGAINDVLSEVEILENIQNTQIALGTPIFEDTDNPIPVIITNTGKIIISEIKDNDNRKPKDLSPQTGYYRKQGTINISSINYLVNSDYETTFTNPVNQISGTVIWACNYVPSPSNPKNWDIMLHGTSTIDNHFTGLEDLELIKFINVTGGTATKAVFGDGTNTTTQPRAVTAQEFIDISNIKATSQWVLTGSPTPTYDSGYILLTDLDDNYQMYSFDITVKSNDNNITITSSFLMGQIKDIKNMSVNKTILTNAGKIFYAYLIVSWGVNQALLQIKDSTNNDITSQFSNLNDITLNLHGYGKQPFTQNDYNDAQDVILNYFKTNNLYTLSEPQSAVNFPDEKLESYSATKRAIYNFITTYSGPGALTATQKASIGALGSLGSNTGWDGWDIDIKFQGKMPFLPGEHIIDSTNYIIVNIPAAIGLTPSDKNLIGAKYTTTPPPSAADDKIYKDAFNDMIQKFIGMCSESTSITYWAFGKANGTPPGLFPNGETIMTKHEFESVVNNNDNWLNWIKDNATLNDPTVHVKRDLFLSTLQHYVDTNVLTGKFFFRLEDATIDKTHVTTSPDGKRFKIAVWIMSKVPGVNSFFFEQNQ